LIHDFYFTSILIFLPPASAGLALPHTRPLVHDTQGGRQVKCSVEDKLKALLNLRTVGKLVESGVIPRTVGEVQRVLDLGGEH